MAYLVIQPQLSLHRYAQWRWMLHTFIPVYNQKQSSVSQSASNSLVPECWDLFDQKAFTPNCFPFFVNQKRDFSPNDLKTHKALVLLQSKFFTFLFSYLNYISTRNGF